MNNVKSGERYKHKNFDWLCTVSNVYQKGAGYQVCYKIDGNSYGLVTSRGNFLSCFDRVDD